MASDSWGCEGGRKSDVKYGILAQGTAQFMDKVSGKPCGICKVGILNEGLQMGSQWKAQVEREMETPNFGRAKGYHGGQRMHLARCRKRHHYSE